MEILSKVVLIFSLLILFHYQIESTVTIEFKRIFMSDFLKLNNFVQVNHIKFERITCQKMPNTIVSDVGCIMKYISREYAKCHMWVNLTAPLHDAWFHSVVYYRYNPTKYQRFPVNLWENPCDWLNGKRSWVLDWSVTVKRVLKYTNINLRNITFL